METVLRFRKGPFHLIHVASFQIMRESKKGYDNTIGKC